MRVRNGMLIALGLGLFTAGLFFYIGLTDGFYSNVELIEETKKECVSFQYLGANNNCWDNRIINMKSEKGNVTGYVKENFVLGKVIQIDENEDGSGAVILESQKRYELDAIENVELYNIVNITNNRLDYNDCGATSLHMSNGTEILGTKEFLWDFINYPNRNGFVYNTGYSSMNWHENLKDFCVSTHELSLEIID